MSRHPATLRMPGQTAWSTVRCCARLLAALAVAFSIHGIVQASCGDYVLVRDAHGRLVPVSRLNGRHEMPPDDAADLPAVPCHGPSCSRAPSAPPAAPFAPILWPTAPEGLWVQRSSGSECPGGAGRELEDGPAHPIHHPGRVFRPPR